ncbi:MAG: anhydro-N-acetylmuramic acid kinase [Pseudomonadales bacterium]
MSAREQPIKHSALYVGAMTGTSLDGLDLALLELGEPDAGGKPKLHISEGQTLPLPAALRAELAALTLPGENEIERLGRADRRLGEFIGTSVLSYLTGLGLTAADIRAIGSHGQTIRHRPDADAPFTLQIGDPNCIAEVSGIDTVADFRRRDVAAGGQGAPLVPLFHRALFNSQLAEQQAQVAVLNIGGISNLSLLGDDSSVLGFDCGPGNGLMDAWIARHKQLDFDENGAWASSGQADGVLLEQLLADPYFSQAPPKSTGREYFSLSWLQGFARVAQLQPEQVQATLAELTARSVGQSIADYGDSPAQLFVCGGGRLNRHLLRRLRALCPMPVHSTEDVGINGDSLEAAAFAWLAHRTIEGLAGSAPSVTGAKGSRVLGAIFPG